MNVSRGKAGMDEATMSGLQERVHPGLPPHAFPFMNKADYIESQETMSGPRQKMAAIFD
jgi:hypothetical protein